MFVIINVGPGILPDKILHLQKVRIRSTKLSATRNFNQTKFYLVINTCGISKFETSLIKSYPSTLKFAKKKH